MFIPLLATRIEKRNDLTRCFQTTGYIRPFSRVARLATPCEIPRVIGTVMLLGDDVLQMKGRRPIVGMMAILAALPRTFLHTAPRRGLHCFFFARCIRAWAFKTSTTLATAM